MRLTVALLAAGLAVAPAATAAPGPPLREPEASLRTAFGCKPPTTTPARKTVLLLHGGLATAGQWEHSYEPALRRLGHGVCVVTIPDRATIDAQRSAEYVVHAIRAAARWSGEPVSIVGHSFGGSIASMVLRLWPDLAQSVDDVVGLASPYTNGSQSIAALCLVPCARGAWQLAAGSRLNRALARRPLYRGPDYTALGTDFDELVTPQPSAGHLPGATNLQLQKLCPGRVVDHVSILLDSVAFAVVRDAVEHAGPADPRRIPSSVCERFATYPGADPARLVEEVGRAAFAVPAYAANVTAREPALRCAWDPDCPKPRLRPSMSLRHARGVASGTLTLPDRALGQCGGRVLLRSGRARVRTTVRVDCSYRARIRRRRTVIATFAGTTELLSVEARAR